MNLELIPAVALFLSLGLALQSAVGFGCGLFAIPLMLAAGVELPVAIAVTLAGVLGQTGWSTWQYRQHVPWRLTFQWTAIRLVSMPVGIWLLGLLAEQGRSRIKAVVGLMLLAVVTAQWALKPRPREHVAGGWTLLAGLTSGLMAGLLGMGGPPVVLWTMAHDWDGRRARAFQWAVFLQLMPVQMGLLIWKFGDPVMEGLLTGLLLMPVLLIAATVGMALGERMSRQRLRLAAYGLLVLIAAGMVAG